MSIPLLRRIIEDELGWHLVARSVPWVGSDGALVGMAVRDVERVGGLEALADRLFAADGVGTSDAEWNTRLAFWIQTGRLGHRDVGRLRECSIDDVAEVGLRQIADLWLADRDAIEVEARRARRFERRSTVAAADLKAARADFEALVADATRNAVELTQEIVSLREQLGASPRSDRRPKPSGESRPFPFLEADDAAAPVTDGASLIRADTGHRPGPSAEEIDPWPGDRPLASVVITSFNYSQFLDDAVASALAQTYPSLEIIVVEGGSTDSASRLHAAALDRSRVRVLMQGEPHRAGANRNFGISQARGKYVCCLDADDMLQPTYVEKAVFLLEHGGFDVVSTSLEKFGAATGVFEVPRRPCLNDLITDNYVLTCAVQRRHLWAASGGFRDSDLRATGHLHEDWEYWVRLAALGARFYNMAGEALLLYREHGSNISQGRHVLSVDKQRELIRSLNSERLTPDAFDRSARLAAERPFARASASTLGATSLGGKPGEHAVTVMLAMPFLTLGGAERLLSEIVGHLAGRGFRIIVVTTLPKSRDVGDTTEWFARHVQEIYQLPLFLPEELWSEFLLDTIRSKSVDILWIAGSTFAYDALRAVRATMPQVRVVDLLFNLVGHVDSNRRHRTHIDLTLVESAVVRDGLLALGESADRIRIVQSGIDLDRLTPALRSPDFRRSVGAAEADIVVTFCGRWAEEKAPLRFVELARSALPEWPVRFVMTGAGPLAEGIQNAVDAAGFHDGRFHLLGEVPDSGVVIASSDVVVVPSILDGRPLVALESLACGTPLIASRVGDLPGLVRPGETGWLCDPGDGAGLLAALAAAVENPERLASMRAAARRFACEHLDQRRMAADYEQALVSLLSIEDRSLPDGDGRSSLEPTSTDAGRS